ncbi:MAG TPA: hypothetical protein VKM55_06635 [Candidatus Lokiarchaeia archaeon]|nr:hypothetical protein [Candidatus Lokiarchaeia archaeon]
MRIIDYRESPETLKELDHLAEYQVKPEDLPKEFENFRPRGGFPAGHLLVGDLVINEESSKQLEVHPFPEWVVQLVRLDTASESGDGYCVVFNVDAKDSRKIEKKDWRERKDIIKELVKNCQPENLIAFRMVPGICVKVMANIPHYFIAAAKNDATEYPYCQVFEPNVTWEELVPFGKFEPTAYFQTPFEIRVES